MKRRFHLSIGRRGIRRDVDKEIQFYIDMRTQELIDEGVHPDLARRSAIESFGDRRSVASECRSIRRNRFRLDLLRGVGHDVRFAFRSLRRSPGFTAAIVVTLGLGIGANTAIFSLINGVLLQPLPYQQGGALVRLQQPVKAAGGRNVNFSPPEVSDYVAQSQTLTGLVEYHSMPFILLGLDEPERVQTGVVSAGFFDLLGVEPILGRRFLPGEDQPGAEPVLVLSHHTWRQIFDGDPGVTGREVEMNDKIHVIVGVLPEIPHHPNRNDVYMPVSACPFRSAPAWAESRGARGLTVFGRIESGATIEQVRSDLQTVAGRLHQSHPSEYPGPQGYATTVVPLRDELISRAKPSLYILLGAAGFLLLIVSANVANMTLARLVQREREFAIRATLGAGRGRLFRQLLTESTILALIGGGLGLGLAYVGLDVLVAFLGRLTTRAAEVRIDTAVLGFTAAISLGTGFVVSLLPALPTRVTLAGELKAGGTGGTGRGRRRMQGLLIVSQVAVSFVLLVGAGLMLRTFVNLIRVDPGFDSSHVLTARLDLDWSRYTTGASRHAFADDLTELLSTRPGIQSVAFTSSVPLNGQPSRPLPLIIKGRDTPERPLVEARIVSKDYFRVIEIPLLSGETFFLDDDDAPHVVVNATMAERYLDGVDQAVGKHVRLGSDSWWRVIGVVGDVRHDGLGEAIDPAVYRPQSATGMRDMRVIIRSSLDQTNTAMLLRRLVRSIDPDQPVTDVRSLVEVRRESLTSPRVTALLLGGFALLALVITATGIAGVIAYSVSQRTREIGIRMALGAGRDSVLAMVLRQGLREVIIGLTLGFVGALVLARILDGVLTGSGLLFGIHTTDVLTFGAVTLVLLAVALLACTAPARRATAIDPLHALRTE